MKKTILFLAFALFASVGFSQEVPVKVIALRGLTSGTLFSGKAYIDSQSDTSQVISVRPYKFAYVRFTALDSAGAVVVWYRTVINGTTYAPKVTIGTVAANTNNGGNKEAFALPATALASPNIQLGATFAGSGNGVSSATYTLDVVVK